MFQFGWMAMNTYFEAQGESFEGKIAVNQVVIQRVFERNMSAYDVIHQRHQFSWLWDDIPDVIRYTDDFLVCLKAATTALEQRLEGDNFYHANLYHSVDMKVYPPWSSNPKVKKVAIIDNHIFYREPWKTSKHWTLVENK
jgi:spore germination cell wall hydrolase CwlJ-like protein